MPELSEPATLERDERTTVSASHPDVPPSPSRGRSHSSKWWVISNFGYLVVWWVVVIGYYVVINSIRDRDHRGLIDLQMISDGWYAILASALIGAFYVNRFRLRWFLMSIVLAMLILVLMLLVLGTLKSLMNP